MNRLLNKLKQLGTQLASESDALLSFEWVLLLTLLTIGIVGGLTAARDAIIDELGDVSEAVVSFDQSYTLAAFNECGVTAPGSSYTDQQAVVNRCSRFCAPGQGTHIDCAAQ